MSDTPATLPSSTRPLPAELVKTLQGLKKGQKIRIVRDVVINSRHKWAAAPVEGVFSHINFLATGIQTDRVPEDEIVVVTVHFLKLPQNELSSVTLDPTIKIEVLG
jgi:hypothetical protein